MPFKLKLIIFILSGICFLKFGTPKSVFAYTTCTPTQQTNCCESTVTNSCASPQGKCIGSEILCCSDQSTCMASDIDPLGNPPSWIAPAPPPGQPPPPAPPSDVCKNQTTGDCTDPSLPQACSLGMAYDCCNTEQACRDLTGVPTTHANPNQQPAGKSCNNILDTKDPEFNSLRPYPGMTCVTQIVPSASFCGNDLTLHETVSETYVPGDPNCKTNGNKVTCSYNVSVPAHQITIDLSGANLPFAGNTENVPNSKSKTGTPPPLSDTDKVNGYVSWYLNGVENRAENGTSGNTDENTDYNTVNLSGPINKLLPSAILDAQRIKTIQNVTNDVNHNQIVVCAKSSVLIIGNIFDVGHFTPEKCYPNGDGSAAQQQTFRLKTSGIPLYDNNPVIQFVTHGSYGWDGSLSWIRDILNLAPGAEKTILLALTADFPTIDKSVVQTAIKTSITTAWNLKTPPLPWDDGTGVPFVSELYYRKAYSEWKGDTCVIIPLVNKLICFDNWFIPNKYADLYSYIPLSSTEDLEGNIIVDKASSDTSPITGGVTVTGVGFDNQTPSTLFFPHMLEGTQLATLLQNTFVSTSETGKETAAPTDVSQTSCSTIEVRSNKGDSLFAKSLTGALKYTTNFSCDFDSVSTDPNCISECLQNAKDPSTCQKTCQRVQTCTKDVYISLSTTGQIPEIDNLWSQLVAGPEAIFKRIFPKTNTAGSVGKIIDIPGSTNITYTGTGGDGVTQQSTDLKFPHLGGISEYFLNGIQTALRPKGFGNPITFDANSSSGSCSSTSLPTLPGATDTSCKVCNYSISPLFQKIIESAAQTFNVPASVLLGTMQHEGAFNPGNTWSDANVKSWSVCGGSFPGCHKDDMNNAQHPFGFIPGNFYADEKVWGAVRKVDPSRTKDTVSPCNVLDGTYAMAATLSMWSGGLPTDARFPLSQDPSQTYSKFPDTCYSWDLNNGTSPAPSCAFWTKTTDHGNTIATSQVGYGGWCPEPGKHPIQPYFPDGSGWIDSVINYANDYTCK